MREEVFTMFPAVRNGYFKLIEVLCNQNYTVADLEKIRQVAKRIQINNLITTILDSIERFTFSELSNEDIQELGRCFSDDGIDVNMIRNCIAHAHYTVDRNAENIQFKKGNFCYNISFEKLSNIANKVLRFAHNRVPEDELQFNGIKLNEFIDNIINEEETVDGNAYMLATLIQSYNIYHAFLYEKAIQDKEQKRFAEYYENKMKLNLDLPYINQEKKQNPVDINFDTIRFEELTQRSRADLIYFMMTSEYRTEVIEYFKGKFDGIEDDEKIIKKIYAMYLYSCSEYKDVIEKIFGKNEDVEQYIIQNVSEQDYENCNDIIDFMIRKMPKSGRIEMGKIMPKNKDLVYGFEKAKSLNEGKDNLSFVYPSMDILITRGTEKELFQRYITCREIQDEFKALEITEDKVITLPEFMLFISTKLHVVERYIEVPENIRKLASTIKETQEENPNMGLGQIYGNIMKAKENKELRGEVSSFYKDVPDNLKKEYLMSKLKEEYVMLKLKKEYFKIGEEDNIELIYRNLLFLLYYFGTDERLLELKKDIELELTSNYGKMNIVDKEKLSRMRELGKIFDYRGSSEKEHVDFTDLLTHIRDSSIHAFTEVDFSGVAKRDFVVRKKSIYKDTPNDKVDLSGIRFNFQDYNPSTKETSFLLTNIPLDQVIEIIDLPSDKLISRKKERSGEDDTDGR